jgi:hypothetical protein
MSEAKQHTITGEPEPTKRTRTILPPHERIARDEQRLKDAKAKLVQSLLARESELIDELGKLERDCDAAKDPDATKIAGRVGLAVEALNKVQ